MCPVIEEDLRKNQRPVMESATFGGRIGVAQKLRAQSLGQRTGAIEQARGELAKRAAIGRSPVGPEPSRTPQVEEPRPRRQRRILGVQCRQRSLLLTDDGRGVVGFHREPQTDLNRVLNNGRQAFLWKEREVFVSPATWRPASRLAAKIVG